MVSSRSDMRNPWGLEYSRTPDRYIWGKAPSAFARELVGLVPRRGRILDLGCGEGRDSVYFAERGFTVTGVDAQDGIDHCHSGERIVTCASRDEACRLGDDPPPRVA